MANETYGVTIASDASKIKADLAALYGALGQTAGGFNKNATAAKQLEAAWATAGARARTTATQIQRMTMHTTNLTYQLNDIAVMMAAGQNPFLLMMQQGTQINQIWGQMTQGTVGLKAQLSTVGSALSASFAQLITPLNLLTLGIIALGATLIPLGVSMIGFKNSTTAAADALEEMDEDAEKVRDALYTLQTPVKDLAKEFGTAADAALRFAKNQAEAAYGQSMQRFKEQAEVIKIMIDEMIHYTDIEDEATKARAKAAGDYYKLVMQTASGPLKALQRQAALTDEQTLALADSFQAVVEAGNDTASVQAALVALDDQLNALGITVSESLNSAILEALGLIWQLGVEGARLVGLGEQIDKPTLRGGGGSKKDKLKDDLKDLQKELRTETEQQLFEFAEQQKVLKDALERKLITYKEHFDLLERLKRDHALKMMDIEEWQQGEGLHNAGVFFGQMAEAFSSGNDKMMRVGKAFGAAQALINSWVAFTDVLRQPIPFFMKIPAAMSVLAAGFNAVNAIKGINPGSSATTPSGVGAAPSISRNVLIELTGGPMYSKGQVKDLINSINEAIEDGATLRLA